MSVRSDVLELIERVPGVQPVAGPRSGRRIYVNRNLRMDAIDHVGFDMDYTLLIYNQPEIERLSIELTIQKMIEGRSYPQEIAQLPFDGSFAIRGSVVDRKLGNLLKVDRYGHVGRGYHGSKKLEKEDRMRLYRAGTRMRLRPPRFAWIDTLFALPEATMYTGLVDYLEPRNPSLSFDALWQDVRECIDEAHRDDTLKSIIKANLPRYIIPDPMLPETLHKLRSAGKRLFLLTNSLWDYTDAVMSFLFNDRLPAYPSWRNYFDLIMVGSAKPGFFTGDRPFAEIDPQGRVLSEPAASLGKGRIYQAGNLETLQSVLGAAGDRVLYIGDHIYGDMLRSKKSSNWRTALIVQELEQELETRDRLLPEITELEDLARHLSEIDAEISFQQRVLKTLHTLQDHQLADRDRVEQARRDAKAALEGLRTRLEDTLERHTAMRRHIDDTFHPKWGQLFREGNENSRFGEQVESYACIYTSRVSNFLSYSPLQYFRAPRDYMPHELI